MKKNAKYSFTIGRGVPVDGVPWNGITNAPSSLESDRIEANWSTKNYNPVARYVKLAEAAGGPDTI